MRRGIAGDIAVSFAAVSAHARSGAAPSSDSPHANAHQRGSYEVEKICPWSAPSGFWGRSKCDKFLNVLARPKRFELLTPKFVVWCSIQ